MFRLRLFLFFVFTAFCLFIPNQARAEIDIELSSFAMQDINLMSRVDKVRRSSGKIGLRFSQDYILIKSELVNMTIDFEQRIIEWQEVDENGLIRNFTYAFRDILDGGASLSRRFADPETLLENGVFKKSGLPVDFEGRALEKWKQKLGGRSFREVWTDSAIISEADFRQIKASLARLMNETGVLVSVGETAEWFASLFMVDRFTVLMYRHEYKQAAYAKATVIFDQYYAITKIGRKDFMMPEDIKKIADQRSAWEKFQLGFIAWSDSVVEFRMLMPTIVIVILILSPLWYPWLSARIIDSRHDKAARGEELQKSFNRCYNFLVRIKKPLEEGKPDSIDSFQINELKNFIGSYVFKRYFSSIERMHFKKLLNKLSAGGESIDCVHLAKLTGQLLDKTNKITRRIDKKYSL